MNNTIVFSEFRQGASHKPNKPCQDYARHFSSDDIDIITLSDGHGGKKYFRSNFGAEIVTEIAMNTLKIFCKEVNFETLLASENFIQVPIAAETDTRHTELEYVMRHVFQHICSEWHRKIEEHFKDNPITLEEEAFLRKETEQGKSLFDYYFDTNRNYIKKSLPSAYGCTLFGIAVTKRGYWIGFQIGDGKCVAFKEDGSWFEPIPWDERCFQNQTTSISHYDEESFRYCIGRNIPDAVFIASDGMDDSYAPMQELAFEYAMNFLANLAINGEEYTVNNIGHWLDKISDNYSRDDMSIGYIVNHEKLSSILNSFINTRQDSIIKEMKKFEIDASNQNSNYENKMAECDNIETQINILKSQLNELNEDINNKATQWAKVKDDLDSEQRHQQEGQEYLRKLSKQLYNEVMNFYSSVPNQDFSKLERDVNQLDNDIKQLMKQIRKKQQSLSDYNKQKKEIEQILPVLKKRMKEANASLEGKRVKLNRITKIKDLLDKNI